MTTLHDAAPTADWPLVELLLCAADLNARGYATPITEAAISLGLDTYAIDAAADWVREVWTEYGMRGVAGSRVAWAYLEAAYRIAEGRGAR